jgi:amino acid transporter
MLLLSGCILIFLIFLLIYQKKTREIYIKNILNRLINFSLINFVIILLLLFFSYEEIPFLSSRFWYLLWLVGIILWLYFIIKNIFDIPEKRRNKTKEREFNKYLPK